MEQGTCLCLSMGRCCHLNWNVVECMWFQVVRVWNEDEDKKLDNSNLGGELF